MRKLLIPLLTAFLLPISVEANWFGKYNSRYDANEACEKWMLKGFEYTYKVIGKKIGADVDWPIEPKWFYKKYESGITMKTYVDSKAADKYFAERLAAIEELGSKIERTKSGFSRSCLEEKETNQFIGRAKSCLKKKEYSVEEWKKLFELKSCEKRKYFKY